MKPEDMPDGTPLLLGSHARKIVKIAGDYFYVDTGVKVERDDLARLAYLPGDARNMTVEGIIAEIVYSDGGQAAEADVLELNAEDNGPFVVLKSWYDEGNRESHEWLRSIENKRVRVTVEVL